MGKKTEAAVLVSILNAFVAGANAQAADESDADQNVIEEIIVTASKRATSLQDTAIAVSALSAETIKRENLIGMDDYLRHIPSANFIDRGPATHELVIRGLSTSAQDSSSRTGPLVGVYFGETPISGLGFAGGTSDIKLIDIERIEVLKGPQGTLYGAGAMGGVVRNIPAAPDQAQTSGWVNVGYSKTARLGSDNSKVEAMINVPLIEDQLAIRAVGYRHDNSGYYRNVSATDPAAIALAQSIGGNTTFQDDIGATKYTGARISALWTPNDKLSIDANYLHQEVRTNGWGQGNADIGGRYDQSRLLLRLGSSISALDAGEEPSLPINNEMFDDTISILQATLEYDFGWASLLSSTSLIEQTPIWNRDLTDIFIGAQHQESEGESLIQELRLSSQLGGPLQFLVGYYYEDQDISTATNIHWNGDPALIPPGTADKFRFRDFRNLEQHALFGELTYDLTDQLSLVAGARAFKQTRVSRTGSSLNNDPIVLNPLESEVDDINYKAGINYRPNDATLLYTSFSQGFRLGDVRDEILDPSCDRDGDGFYDLQPSIPTGVAVIPSDSVDTYELGGKLTRLGGRMQFNVSAYQTDWQDLPVTVSVCDGNFGVRVNGGEARVRGLEFAVSYLVADGWMFDLSGAYTDGELTETTSLGEAGTRLPSTPEYSISGGLEYSFELRGNPAYVRSNYSYISGYRGELDGNTPEMGDFGKLDASAGVQVGGVDLSLFARNLTNEAPVTSIVFNFDNRRSYLRPRTIGIQLRYNF